MLKLKDVSVRYGRIQAVRGISIEVQPGEIVAMVGANGAGKSTILRAISGLVPVSSGEIWLDDCRLDRVPAHRRVLLGLAHALEGRQVFSSLSVEDNIRLGAFRRGRDCIATTLETVYEIFPALRDRSRQLAGNLSGGQQQMLAIARALAARPRILLLDEPSMGISPLLCDEIFAVIGRLRSTGVSILLVEQNARRALAVADRAYIPEAGNLAYSGSAASLAQDSRVKKLYLGS